MTGWVVDVLVGWIVGSIVLGFAFDIVAAMAGTSDSTENGIRLTGVVAGTVLGIWWMRRRRARDELAS